MPAHRLWIIIVSLLLAACGGREALTPAQIEAQAFDDLKAELRATVTDPARAEISVSQLTQLRQEYDLFRKVVEERRIRGRALNADYDTTREQFDAFLNDNREQMRLSRERVTSAYRTLRETLTDDEWQAFGQATSDAVADMIDSLRAI